VKFRVERDVLAEAVTWVARGLPARPPVPVLAGILLHAEDDGTLTLSAFDYEVSARITVAAEVSEPGTVLVLGRLLADISRNLPDRPIDVVTEGSKVQVTCGSSRFSLLMMPADDYPTLPSRPPSGSIDGHLFTQAVAQVSVAADRGDTLPILTGVRVEVEGDTMTLLATDRYRLAMRELHWNPTATDASHVVLIPARTLSEISRSLGASGSVDVALGTAAGGDGLVGFEAGQRHTTTRLLDGEYPKVASIFPSSSETEAVVRTATSSRPSSAWRSSPSATRPCGCASARDRSRSRPAPATTPRRPRPSRPPSPARDRDRLQPHLPARRARCGGHPVQPHLVHPGLEAGVLTGQAEEDGEADTSYRYVLMPVRLAS
jgi:DNA polymerase-3 subunit beta